MLRKLGMVGTSGAHRSARRHWLMRGNVNGLAQGTDARGHDVVGIHGMFTVLWYE